MHWDLDLMKFVFEIVAAVSGCCAALAIFFLDGRFKPRSEIREDEKKLAQADTEKDYRLEKRFAGLGRALELHDRRIVVCEQGLVHAPKKEDLQAVSFQVAGVARELSELRGEQAAQNALLATIHDHLLNSKNK